MALLLKAMTHKVTAADLADLHAEKMRQERRRRDG
jgi:hypothetical protein